MMCYGGDDDIIISSCECGSGPEIEDYNGGNYRAEAGGVHMNK